MTLSATHTPSVPPHAIYAIWHICTQNDKYETTFLHGDLIKLHAIKTAKNKQTNKQTNNKQKISNSHGFAKPVEQRDLCQF